MNLDTDGRWTIVLDVKGHKTPHDQVLRTREMNSSQKDKEWGTRGKDRRRKKRDKERGRRERMGRDICPKGQRTASLWIERRQQKDKAHGESGKREKPRVRMRCFILIGRVN